MNQAQKNTLSSLTGFPVKDAMAGLATGNRTGKPAERKQEILTPQSIVDVCNEMWGQISFDPCYHPEALTNPVTAVAGPLFDNLDGLKCQWPAKTYVNPPYKDLKKWLKYGLTQPREQIWLVPVRTHRGWWREWRDQLDAYKELDPISFVGYESKFPAPLLLGYMGSSVDAFVSACRKLKGEVYPK